MDFVEGLTRTTDVVIGCSVSVARCTEKSVLIRIFEMIRIFIRKSANGTEI